MISTTTLGLDLAVANAGSNTVGILLGYGNGFLRKSGLHIQLVLFPRSVAIGDFNSDSRLDLAVANINNNTVSILLGYGNGSFANQTTYPTSSAPISVAVGDFDNDHSTGSRRRQYQTTTL